MKLIEFSQREELPNYIKSKSGLAEQVLFSVFFALLFINIYKPFNTRELGNTEQLEYFLWSCGVVLVGFVVLSISRILFYQYALRHRIFYWVYAVWIFGEISSMSIIYTAIAKIWMPRLVGGVETWDLFWNVFVAVFFVLLIPTVIAWLYLAFKDKKKGLMELQGKVQETMGGIASTDQPYVLQFRDEKGEPKFSVKAESVIWLEASDNYVIIKYQNQGKISEFLLRNSLKRLAEDFKDTTLFRCHRSYMVNFNHAVALRKGVEGLVLELDVQPLKEIPVSKTYKEETSAAFMQYTCSK